MNDRDREWLETDGLGGFASGTVAGVRTRRYHGLLVTAATPPTGRMVLVSGFDATVETPGGRWMLSTQRYAPGVTGGDGEQHIESFALQPWPTWIFRLPDGTRIQHELLMRAGAPQVFLAWRLLSPSRAPRPAPDLAWTKLTVRPFLASRDFHALMRENPAFSFDHELDGGHFRYRPYGDAEGPTIVVSSSGSYRHQPHWYRGFLYDEERRRGLDHLEDLGSPGAWSFELGEGEGALVFSCARSVRDPDVVPALEAVEAARRVERERRAKLGGPLERAADQHLVARRGGRTVIAGYPWFGDWGRDTFIALRGLLLATGRVAEAIEVLSAWAGVVSDGMLPNYFPDGAAAPEYNSVDASLWYVVAVGEALQAGGARPDERRKLIEAIEAILTGYAGGTRFGIRATDDGLLAAGQPGQQLTWMDARVDGREITPRIGKPVEVQALWLNALAAAVAVGAPSAARWSGLLARGRASFEQRFWNPARGCLYDVVDVDHQAGRVDDTLRPNQILAVGGLPLRLLDGARAAQVVDTVGRALLTPLGLRSLAPGEPGYCPRYGGGPRERDGAYHQGTVWPWLLGPFVEAWVRARGGTADAKRAARAQLVAPLLAHLDEAGLGHVSEVADAEAPHTPGGCPFQAWSLGELLRLDRVVLAEGRAGERAPSAAGVDGAAAASL
ncbi:MAG TPA: amylo-alpha-1,6-glucosidase [Polyangia bacterium]|nr:amylo-alpha-1,6-glucosidase [Polyangia bacterium]